VGTNVVSRGKEIFKKRPSRSASPSRADGPSRPVYTLYASCVSETQFIFRPVFQLSKIAKSATQVRPMTVVLNPQEIPFGSCFIWLNSNLYRFARIVLILLFVSAHSMRFYG
jgi:hypothetical protein